MIKPVTAYLFTLFMILAATPVHSQSYDADLEIKEISNTAFTPGRTLLLPDPFDSIKALKTLFPGKYYDLTKRSGYDNKVVNWQCKTCKAQQYIDVNGLSEHPSFPYEDGVATRLINVMNLTDAAGGRYKMLAFSHSTYDVDGFRTGRFSGGMLGLAKFTKTDSGWLMRSFQPAIGAYGAFSSCPAPGALLIGEDQYAFLVRHNNGPGGGPFQVSYFLIAGANGKYSQVMTAYSTDRTNTEQDESIWESKLSVPVSTKKYFRDIVITTSGRYFANKEEDVLPELAEKIEGIRSCNFRFTKRFVYSAAKGYEDIGAENIILTDVKR